MSWPMHRRWPPMNCITCCLPGWTSSRLTVTATFRVYKSVRDWLYLLQPGCLNTHEYVGLMSRPQAFYVSS
jgi:hypothetical protein